MDNSFSKSLRNLSPNEEALLNKKVNTSLFGTVEGQIANNMGFSSDPPEKEETEKYLDESYEEPSHPVVSQSDSEHGEYTSAPESESGTEDEVMDGGDDMGPSADGYRFLITIPYSMSKSAKDLVETMLKMHNISISAGSKSAKLILDSVPSPEHGADEDDYKIGLVARNLNYLQDSYMSRLEETEGQNRRFGILSEHNQEDQPQGGRDVEPHVEQAIGGAPAPSGGDKVREEEEAKIRPQTPEPEDIHVKPAGASEYDDMAFEFPKIFGKNKIVVPLEDLDMTYSGEDERTLLRDAVRRIVSSPSYTYVVKTCDLKKGKLIKFDV